MNVPAVLKLCPPNTNGRSSSHTVTGVTTGADAGVTVNSNISSPPHAPVDTVNVPAALKLCPPNTNGRSSSHTVAGVTTGAAVGVSVKFNTKSASHGPFSILKPVTAALIVSPLNMNGRSSSQIVSSVTTSAGLSKSSETAAVAVVSQPLAPATVTV